MTRWLSSLMAALRRDRPDRPLCEQMRSLWRVPPDWQHRPTWRVRRHKRGLAVVAKTERKAG